MGPLDYIQQDLFWVQPELLLAVFFVYFILLNSFNITRSIHEYSFLGVIIVLVFSCIYQFYSLPLKVEYTLFFEHLIISSSRIYVKFLILSVALLFWVYKILKCGELNYNYHFLVLIAQLFGAFLTIEANSFITLFVGIEIISFSSYLISFWGGIEKSRISGLKYFLFGAFASSLMVYGMSWLFGITGSYFYKSTFDNAITSFDKSFYYLALICFYSGLLFKTSAVPFHLWVIDVYENVTNSLLVVISLIPKIVGLIAIYWIHNAFSRANVMLGETSFSLLMIVSVLTMVIGNFAALKQESFKGLFAYSSIAQSGLLISMLPIQKLDVTLFYLSFYIFMNVGLLYIYELILGENEDKLENISGLGSKNVILSVAILVVIASLIGLPPFSGFVAKFMLATSMFEISNDSFNIVMLCGLVIVFTTLLSLFYYLKIPYYLFVKKYNNSLESRISIEQLFFSAFLVLPLIIGFFSFDWLVSILQRI